MCVFLVLFFASENCKQIHLMWKKTWTSMSNGQRSSPQNVRVVWSIKNSTKTYDSNIIFLLWSLIKQNTTTNSLHFVLKLYCAQLVQCCIRWFRPANWESHKNSAANVTNDEIKCRVEKREKHKENEPLYSWICMSLPVRMYVCLVVDHTSRWCLRRICRYAEHTSNRNSHANKHTYNKLILLLKAINPLHVHVSAYIEAIATYDCEIVMHFYLFWCFCCCRCFFCWNKSIAKIFLSRSP